MTPSCQKFLGYLLARYEEQFEESKRDIDFRDVLDLSQQTYGLLVLSGCQLRHEDIVRVGYIAVDELLEPLKDKEMPWKLKEILKTPEFQTALLFRQIILESLYIWVYRLGQLPEETMRFEQVVHSLQLWIGIRLPRWFDMSILGEIKKGRLGRLIEMPLDNKLIKSKGWHRQLAVSRQLTELKIQSAQSLRCPDSS